MWVGAARGESRIGAVSPIFVGRIWKGRCVQAIVGRIPYWGCKSNLCGAVWKGASNLTGADRGRMWIGANVDWGGAR